MQRATILARPTLVGALRLGEREIARQRDHAAQFGIELLQPVEIDVGEALGGELAGFNPAGKLVTGAQKQYRYRSRAEGRDRPCCARTVARRAAGLTG